MTVAMTKNGSNVRQRSAYQAHSSTLAASRNVIDLSEAKLRRMALRHPDADVRKLASRMLADYLSGTIEVAWENGCLPVYRFTKR